jgi:hypothetical protein
MQIKKGDRFFCHTSVEMDGEQVFIAYRKGKIYTSDEDGCITNDRGGKLHSWSTVEYLEKYFSKLEENQAGPTTSTADMIIEECDSIKNLLLEKNIKYGDSATKKGVVFDLSPVVAIKARINDKLSRLKKDSKDEDEDIILDLLGYFILLRISMKQEHGK